MNNNFSIIPEFSDIISNLNIAPESKQEKQQTNRAPNIWASTPMPFGFQSEIGDQRREI